jgi:lysophospholipase L1-like esterase
MVARLARVFLVCDHCSRRKALDFPDFSALVDPKAVATEDGIPSAEEGQMRGPVTGRRRFAALLAGAVGVVLATTVAVPGAGAAVAQPAPGGYVALGDSFTAGPLVPNQRTDPLGCLRSDRNYPSLVAAARGSSLFRDVSCSGADTGDMTQAQGVTPGPNPPQFDVLTPATALVTLGIGGNDIGFSGIIEECVTLLPWETPCRDRYTAGGTDELTARIAATAPRVAATLAGIRDRSPQARVLVVGYPAIVPDTGRGCWPSVPIGWDDVGYLRAKHKELNAMLAAQAAAAGATYVDAYAASVGRDACASVGRRWVEPLVPGNAAAPFHPNARGMQGVAGVVLAASGP